MRPSTAQARDLTTRWFQDFHDIFGIPGFEDLFGVAAPAVVRNLPQRGSDLSPDMTLTFEEASAGVTTKIKLPRQEILLSLQRHRGEKGSRCSCLPTCAGFACSLRPAGIFHITRLRAGARALDKL